MNNLNNIFSGELPVFSINIIILLVWSLFWKGLSLWHSAKRGQPWWFLVFLIINTVGVLEIAYLFFILKLKVKNLFVNK